MKDITYPTNFFDRPFADTGNKQIIPENPGSTPGRASLADGFPTETQLPLNQGGIAPNRTDFNGAFYMLSAMAFWQQSGGQWQWSAALNYTTPCLVFHDGKLWWAIKASGPSTMDGSKTPGASPDYWMEFLQALANMSGGGSSSVLGNPVGTIIMYHSTVSPDGYLSCDGGSFSATTYPKLYALLGKATTPDMRGMFVRGYDPSGVNDPDGSSRQIGTGQNDALQNITGTMIGYDSLGDELARWTGAFSRDGMAGGGALTNNPGQMYASFDASRVARTSTETRPKNINLLYCIKHD